MKKLIILPLLTLLATVGFAQFKSLQYFRPYDQSGINVFEPTKIDSIKFDGMRVRVGGGFAMQFQALKHANTAKNLVELGTDFNLPTANLNLDVQLHDGVRMHLRTFLSARHHNEAWIKGGYMQIDKLDFIKPGFLGGFMEVASIRIGLDEFNYGDAHFRRSDNAQALVNPFVENYIMDSYSTEAFGELTIQKNGLIAMIGLTNGKLNQNVITNAASNAITADNKPSLLAKIGYDNQLSDDLRVRLTGSIYRNQGVNTGTWLYGGDRAGSRYYKVMTTKTFVDDPATPAVNEAAASITTDFDGRFNARFTKLTAIQINPFVKFKGLEFFGVYEIANGGADILATEAVPASPPKVARPATPATTEGSFTQIGAELIYRFGASENFYVGAKYNTVSGRQREDGLVIFENATPDKTLNVIPSDDLQISRLNFAAGWFMTENIVTKVEYVTQEYKGNAWIGSNARFGGGKFKGIVIEAVISF